MKAPELETPTLTPRTQFYFVYYIHLFPLLEIIIIIAQKGVFSQQQSQAQIQIYKKWFYFSITESFFFSISCSHSVLYSHNMKFKRQKVYHLYLFELREKKRKQYGKYKKIVSKNNLKQRSLGKQTSIRMSCKSNNNN